MSRCTLSTAQRYGWQVSVLWLKENSSYVKLLSTGSVDYLFFNRVMVWKWDVFRFLPAVSNEAQRKFRQQDPSLVMAV